MFSKIIHSYLTQKKRIERSQISSHKTVSRANSKQETFIICSPRKAFLKNLLISNLKLDSILLENDEKIYNFTTDFYAKPLMLVENQKTSTLILKQDSTVIQMNQYLCETLLKKVI